MSALSFSAAVAVRPAALNAGVKAPRVVNTTTKALGGFGPNMPKEEYLKKMEAKKKLIEANKAKAAGKKQGGGLFGKKAAAPAAPEKKGLFGKKPAAAAKKEEKKSFFSFGKK